MKDFCIAGFGEVMLRLAPEDYDFEKMLDGVTHLHLSGNTPFWE